MCLRWFVFATAPMRIKHFNNFRRVFIWMHNEGLSFVYSLFFNLTFDKDEADTKEIRQNRRQST